MPTKPVPEYSESTIRILKGLEPVKQRPGMYTRTDNPLHVIQEVIDNAADEALAGFGKKIRVTLHADGSVSVEDDGRGIPHGLHPEENVPVLELVFARLHAGGKFDKGAGGAYSFSGGLHGVGVSVTNALATRMQVQSFRDGAVASMEFAGGDVAQALALREPQEGERRRGTTVRVWPDARYFESPQIPVAELVHVLRSKAVLTRRRKRRRAGSTRAACATTWSRACPRMPSCRCSRARAMPRRTTTTLPRARARSGCWPSPKTAIRCARATST